MFTRIAMLAAVALVASAVSLRAADLPTGTWAANVNDTKSELIITEVKDGKVKGVLAGTDFAGVWNAKTKTLTFTIGNDQYEGHLVSEAAEKGKTKCTLTGTREESVRVPTRAVIHKNKTGWYAQMTADPPPVVIGEIKAEIRGVLVVEGTNAYVSVKQKVDGDETRIWVWATEGEWKVLKDKLPPFNGKEVIVTGKLGQIPKGHKTSIPVGGLYIHGGFDIKRATPPKE